MFWRPIRPLMRSGMWDKPSASIVCQTIDMPRFSSRGISPVKPCSALQESDYDDNNRAAERCRDARDRFQRAAHENERTLDQFRARMTAKRSPLGKFTVTLAEFRLPLTDFAVAVSRNSPEWVRYNRT